VYVLATRIDVHIAEAQSLKDKRRVVTSIVDGARRRYGVASSQVDGERDLDRWQRASLGFAAVSNSQHHTTEVIDEVSRFVWSFPEVAVIEEERTWLT